MSKKPENWDCFKEVGMFIRSTGLGRTLLTARVAKIETTELVPSTLEPPQQGAKEPMRMLMVMQVVHPVNWTVRAFVDPSDLRHMIKTVLMNPGLILKGIKFLFSKDPVYGEPGAEAPRAAAVPGPTAVTAPAAQSMSAAKAAAGPGPIPERKGPGPIPPRRQIQKI